MLRRGLLGLLVTVAIVLVLPHDASAHVLKVDGDIGAVLHINPDDNPTIGGPTDYIISFADNSGKFSLPKCHCTISFILDSQTVDQRPLATSSGTVSENRYTFKTPGVYTIRVSGAPITPGAFQSFQLNYQVRVGGGASSAHHMPPLLWTGIAMAIGLILLAAFSVDDGTIETTKKEES